MIMAAPYIQSRRHGTFTRIDIGHPEGQLVSQQGLPEQFCDLFLISQRSLRHSHLGNWSAEESFVSERECSFSTLCH